MTRKVPCGVCGTPKRVSPASLETPTCHSCRRAARAQMGGHAKYIYSGVCARAGCTQSFTSATKSQRYCSRTCGQLGRFGVQPHEAAKWRKTRQVLIVKAPGLTDSQMRALRNQWRTVKARCYYCPELGTTVDHVIPVSRGGTNYIGNLVPCCQRCNSRKQDRTIMEWRLGKSAPHTQRPVIRELRAVRQPKAPTPERMPHPCDLIGCERMTLRRRYCSPECLAEGSARSVRDKYRASAGLAVDPSRPTKPRSRLATLPSSDHAA